MPLQPVTMIQLQLLMMAVVLKMTVLVIVAEVLNCPVQEKAFITPDDDPGRCLDELLDNQVSPLMLVSHMPFVGSFSTLLVDGHRQGIPFMTSQAVLLDMPVVGPGCADLKAQFLP